MQRSNLYKASNLKLYTMTYINLKTNNEIETIDSFETRKEAFKMLKEYRIASNYYNGAYLSQRATKDY